MSGDQQGNIINREAEKQLINLLASDYGNGIETTNTYIMFDYLGLPQELDEVTIGAALTTIENILCKGMITLKSSRGPADYSAFNIEPCVREEAYQLLELKNKPDQFYDGLIKYLENMKKHSICSPIFKFCLCFYMFDCLFRMGYVFFSFLL